jgi:hypothetical protein
MPFTYDRYLVSSWGRAGSTVITQLTQIHLKKYTDNVVKWYGADEKNELGWSPESGYPSRPWSVIHSHSLVQFNTINDMGVIICLRLCSEQALSRRLAQLSGYLYMYQDWFIQHIKKKHLDENWARSVLTIDELESQSQNFTINCAELEKLRSHAIDWNWLACNRMKEHALGLVYEQWNQDLQIAAKLINIDLDKSKITIKRDPLSHFDRISNQDEVSSWLASHRKKDNELLERWQNMLFRKFF